MLPPKIELGISLKEFQQFYPERLSGEILQTKQYQYKENLQGLDGEWSYDFKDGQLDWFLWDFYDYNITEQNFEKTKQAYKNIIDNYKEIYGEPTEINSENENFKDPYTQRHWGYDVIKATWQTENFNFSVSLRFSGTRGDYYFLTKIEFME